MRIGEAARQSGVTAKAIRYYESIGLIAEPPREPSGYRSYGEPDVSRLRFIASAKQLGLTLDEIRDILGASDQQEVSCPHVVALLENKRDRIDEWIGSAEALRDALERTIEASHDQIAESPADCCPVIERGLHGRAVLVAETDDSESLVPLPRTGFVRRREGVRPETNGGDPERASSRSPSSAARRRRNPTNMSATHETRRVRVGRCDRGERTSRA